MCDKCNTTPCSCTVQIDRRAFIIATNAMGEVQPINPQFAVTFEKFEDQRFTEEKGRFQIIFPIPEASMKVQNIIWKFPSQELRNLAYDNLKNTTCLSV